MRNHFHVLEFLPIRFSLESLMELKEDDRALEILKNGLSIEQTDQEKFVIFKEIMKLAFNSEGNCDALFAWIHN